MGFPPEVFLIGAQKSGTSTLASLLDSHPDLTVSHPKEPHYFTHNYNKGIEWYKEKFENNNNLLIDASTSYSMSRCMQKDSNLDLEGVPLKVYSLNPSAKFIYILRNPIDRAYSGYWHSVRTGRINESFSELIREKSFIHLDISNYYAQLSYWLKYFSLDSFLIIRFDDFTKRQDETLERCFEFLGVNPNVDISSDSYKNKSYVATSFGKKINNLRVNHPFLNKLVKFAPDNLKTILYNLMKKSEIPKMHENDREYLLNYFVSKNKKLSDLTGINFDSWNR